MVVGKQLNCLNTIFRLDNLITQFSYQRPKNDPVRELIVSNQGQTLGELLRRYSPIHLPIP
jgi:hypothetical protein